MEGGSGVIVPVSSHNWPCFWRYVGACSAAAVIKTCAFSCGNSAKMFWNLCGDWRWIVCIILMRPQRIPKKISTWLKKKKRKQESSHSQSKGTKKCGVKSRKRLLVQFADTATDKRKTSKAFSYIRQRSEGSGVCVLFFSLIGKELNFND